MSLFARFVIPTQKQRDKILRDVLQGTKWEAVSSDWGRPPTKEYDLELQPDGSYAPRQVRRKIDISA